MKVLINIANNGNKCFLWCLIRHLNVLKTNSDTITKANKKMSNDLDYEVIEIPLSKKDYRKIEQKNDNCINIFYHENDLVCPVHVSDKKFENCKDLLLIIDENKSSYVYIKYLIDLCSIRQKRKVKNFYRYCLQCFSCERVLVEHNKICLKINAIISNN